MGQGSQLLCLTSLRILVGNHLHRQDEVAVSLLHESSLASVLILDVAANADHAVGVHRTIIHVENHFLILSEHS